MTSHELPLVEELAPPPNVEAVFRRFAAHGHCLFLDSALRLDRCGRYSFLAADPFDYLEFPVDRAGASARWSSVWPSSPAPQQPECRRFREARPGF